MDFRHFDETFSYLEAISKVSVGTSESFYCRSRVVYMLPLMFPGRRGSIGKKRNIQGFSNHCNTFGVLIKIGGPAVGMSCNFVAGQKARLGSNKGVRFII